MARESSKLDDGESPNPAVDGAERSRTSSNTKLLDRRSYLTLTGAGTAGLFAAASGVVGASEHGEYDVIEASGQTVTLEDETFENKLIDVTTGDGITFMIDGPTKIRNVGFKGLYQGGSFLFSITADSGTVEFENVYMGDGANKTGTDFTHGPGAVFYHRDANCDVVFRHCQVQGFPNNAWYCSNTTYGGTARWEECFGKNNGVTTFRCSDPGDELVGCVAYNDDTDYSTDYADWGGYGETAGRPLWVWDPGNPTVKNCHFDAGDYPRAIASYNDAPVTPDGGAVRGGVSSSVDTSNMGNDPTLEIPDGVPTSAEEAASGGSSESPSSSDPEEGSDGSSLLNTIVFDGNGTAETTSYEFVVSDAVEPSTDENATIDEAATVDGTRASGTVADYLDAFRFDGQIERLSVDGNATVRVNGVEIDPADIDDVLQNVVLIDGSDEDATRYEFTVTGDVERSSYDGASIDDEDAIEDGTVYGTVADWKDAFRYSGEIVELTVDGPGTVSVNGERVDPSDFGADLPHVLEVQGTGTPVAFEITVDGEIELAGEEPPEDEATTISGSTAQSTVTDDSLRFNFSGVLTDVSLTGGTPKITVDGEEIDLEEYGDPELLPHAIVFDGTETAEPSTYSFRVDGTVMKAQYRDASIDDGDVVEDTTVRGGVGDWLDAYWFDGDIVDGQILGDATVDIQYNAREQ
ncbi:hypothetical protein [Natrinema ejinorense]|uniref:Right handed beta helix domain-containing protein n=1 Tax=Natrinema ejinorense TaxID=373386 RepID=A0A2A5QQQ7_9EURY|nr:hypothetical protein [Natrinema ejinorense]PCR89144.1 hypothetical protein CP557_00490 [Natrinema ejinorense]